MNSIIWSALIFFLITSVSFAGSNETNCGKIEGACMKAGFTHPNDKHDGKTFWRDCVAVVMGNASKSDNTEENE